MGTHVTLLVHGIGEQVAGETVDEFVGAARHELKLNEAVENNSVLLAEDEDAIPEAKRGLDQLSQYPCEMRRISNGKSDYLFAEVHWSDLSQAPNGLFATALDLLRLVLGLGYLALDNVENNGGSGWGLIRNVVHLFVWIFFLILAPLNALLLAGSLGVLVDHLGVTLGSADGQWSPAYVLVAVGSVLFSVGLWIAWGADTYLKRLFFSGCAILGAVSLLVAITGSMEVRIPINEYWIPACATVSSFELGVPPGINCFVGVVVFILNSVWLLLVGLFLLLCILSLVTRDLFQLEKRSIYLAICAAMMLFWMTFSVAFWSVFRSAVARLAGPDQNLLLSNVFDQHFEEATATLPFVVIAVLFVLVIGALIWARRFMRKMLFRPDRIGTETFSRLILNPSINIALFLSSLLLVIGAFVAAAEWWILDGRTEFGPLIRTANLIIWHFGFINFSTEEIAGIAGSLVGAIGILIVNFTPFIAAALGVGRDIVIYATRSHMDSPSQPVSRARRLRHRLFGDTARTSQYVFRERIEARFRQTFERVLAQERDVEKITVVSHSQGTVISVMGLLRLGNFGGQAAFNNLKKLELVTMGCPLQHIYRHYFHQNYEVGQAPWHHEDRWLNLYRVDDFVGKTVGGKGLSVRDVAVPAAKGHSHYWSDQLVWKALKEQGVY